MGKWFQAGVLAILGWFSFSIAGEIWVPSCSQGDVSVMDSETLSTVATIPLIHPSLGCPLSVAFSEDGAHAFVSVQPDQVVVIDTDSRSISRRIPIHRKSPFGALIFSRPGGDRMYVTDCVGDTLSVIDTALQEMVDIDPGTPEIDGIHLPPGSWTMGFSPDGRYGFTHGCTLHTGIQRLDLLRNQPDGTAPVGEISGVDVSPTGGIVAGTGPGELVVVDTESLEVIARSGVEELGVEDPRLQQIRFQSDGARAYVTDSWNPLFYSFDFTVPAAPLPLAAIPLNTTGSLTDVRIAGNRAFLIAWRPPFPSEIWSVDLSIDPPVPMGMGIAGRGAMFMAVRPGGSGPEKDLSRARGLLENIPLPAGLANALSKKLARVLELLEAGTPREIRKAIHALDGFIHQVNALRGVHLTDEEADRLIGLAASARDALLARLAAGD